MLTSVALILVFCSGNLLAQKDILLKPSGVQTFGWNNFNGNSVNTVISNEGVFGDYRKTSTPGIIWPNGTSKSPLYTAGLWIVGKHRPTDSLRTAVMNYAVEYQPGKILSTFNTTTNSASAADAPGKSIYHLYKINRGDAVEGNPDYDNWPGDLGAPFTDKNGNGLWNKGVDEPLKWGDQQLWSVSNDADYDKHKGVGATKPMGIELQSTFFGYDRPGALSNTVFIRYKIINRSDADYDSVFVGMWSDTDLGYGDDDMVGVDTTLSLSYNYNGDDVDEGTRGYGTSPPSTGFILLQGPKVETNSSSDTAFSEGNKRSGFKNLPIFSYLGYFKGSFLYPEPPINAQPLFAPSLFNNMKGLHANTGAHFVDPATNKPSRFLFSGDPVANNGAGSGWTQSTSGVIGTDVRSMLATGPFTLAKGDTQEIVWAYVIAQDTGRLSSITLLKKYAVDIHQLFKDNFSAEVMPPFPPGPKFKTEQLGFNWKKHQIAVQADTLTTVLSNYGKDTLSLQFSTLSVPSFTIVSPNANAVKIASGKSVALKVSFKPAQIGEILDTIVITTNDSLFLKVKVPLRGEGVDLVPAVPGTVYAVEGANLYTINSSNGAAAMKSQLNAAAGNIFVHPVSKELMTFAGSLIRLSTSNSTFADYAVQPLVVAGYTKGLAYRNDTALYYGSNGYIGKANFELSKTDTAVKLPLGWKVNALSRNPLNGELWFSLSYNVYVGDSTSAVYSADPATGVFRRIGMTKFGNRVNELAFDPNGRLYGLVDSALVAYSHFVRIDTSTGEASVFGPTGVKNLRAMAFDPQTVLGVTIQKNIMPTAYSLKQNYPNPFNPSTAIEYSVPASAHVRLSVYDLLGKEVMNLVNEQHTAGNYSVSMDASRLASGIYMYRITSGNFVETKKMVIVK